MPVIKPTRGFVLNKSHSLARGFVGCWLFNEGSGDAVFDLSGNRNTGILNGNPIWTAGKFGNVLQFNPASNDYITVPNSPSLDFSGDLTALLWLKEDVISDLGHRLLSKRDAGGVQFELYVSSDDGKLEYYDSSSFRITNDVVIIVNTWHQLVVVVSSGGTYLGIYVDAISRALNDTTVNLSSDDADLLIGRYHTGIRELDGQIDHVMIWNRALSAAEIARLYREPFCMFERAIRPGLISGPIINLAGASTALSSLSATAKAIRKAGGTVATMSDVAALLNSIRGEESLLEIERSWLREAFFNGMTANAFKLGTTLSLGWFWVRVAGCSVLYRGPSMERIYFANILTVAAQNACKISPPSYIPHNNSSTYFYVIRRFSNCGYQELTLVAAAKVSIDVSGELEKPQPNNIFSSKAKQVNGNKIQLIWFYCPLEQKSQPVCFNVYYDGGMGQIDYENPLAKISYEGRRFYSYQSGALGTGGYLFTIRAEDADGIENSASAQLKIQLDTANPNAINILSTETV